MNLPLRKVRDDSGQALVEFALVLPMLLLLVFGIIEFGRAWNARQVLTDAAREGTRTMVVSEILPTDASVALAEASIRQGVRMALARGSLDTTAATVITLSGLTKGSRTGTPASVAISYPYRFNTLGKLLKWTTGQSNITLRTTFVMRNE
jgi:Flp pilus assembly protein TadG